MGIPTTLLMEHFHLGMLLTCRMDVLVIAAGASTFSACSFRLGSDGVLVTTYFTGMNSLYGIQTVVWVHVISAV
jgi:hypothetical protein